MPKSDNDDLPRLPTKEEIQSLLERPLDPALDYFDATPSIEQLAVAYRTAMERIVMLERLMQLQASINAKLVSNANQLMFQMQEMEGQPRSALILPDRLNS